MYTTFFADCENWESNRKLLFCENLLFLVGILFVVYYFYIHPLFMSPFTIVILKMQINKFLSDNKNIFIVYIRLSQP